MVDIFDARPVQIRGYPAFYRRGIHGHRLDRAVRSRHPDPVTAYGRPVCNSIIRDSQHPIRFNHIDAAQQSRLILHVKLLPLLQPYFLQASVIAFFKAIH